ncbi:hypothetical protein MPER_09171 [Moniliophthora perniciosa FA553]|nr:hypothetical protein MPER_09171 [Moniliophthora perniciosa FA553]
MRTRERVFGALAVFGSLVGGTGLVLLSVFDTKRHSRLHRIFLLIFMLGVAFSAMFTIVEYRWISKDFRGVAKLKKIYRAKAAIAGILILLAIAFAVALFKSTDVGGILEWVIAAGFTLYLLTFYFDLRQSMGIHRAS